MVIPDNVNLDDIPIINSDLILSNSLHTYSGIEYMRLTLQSIPQGYDFNFSIVPFNQNNIKGYVLPSNPDFTIENFVSPTVNDAEFYSNNFDQLLLYFLYLPYTKENKILVNSIQEILYQGTNVSLKRYRINQRRSLVDTNNNNYSITGLLTNTDNLFNNPLQTTSLENQYAVSKILPMDQYEKYNYYNIYNLVNGEKEFIKQVLYNPNNPITPILDYGYDFNTIQIEKPYANPSQTPFLALQDSFMDIKERFELLTRNNQPFNESNKPTLMQIGEKWKRELIASFPTATTNYRLKSQGIAQSIIDRKDIILTNWLKWANKPDALQKLEKYVDNEKLADLYDKGMDAKMSFSATEINKVVEGIENQRKIMNNLTSYRLEIDLHTRNYYWIVDNLPYQIKHQIISQYINKYDKEIGFPDFIDYDARIEFLKYLETNNIIEVRN